jgi:hypothetical protein
MQLDDFETMNEGRLGHVAQRANRAVRRQIHLPLEDHRHIQRWREALMQPLAWRDPWPA